MGQIEHKLQELLKKAGKFKFAALILLLGVGLMLFPQEKTEQPVQTEQAQEANDLEQRLEEILSKIDGAGEVRVLLTLKEGTSYSYQTDEQHISDEYGDEKKSETVITEDNNGNEAPVVITTRFPVYKGAVILCQGADSAVVRLNIVNAVSDSTGLGSDKISVVKMQGN